MNAKQLLLSLAVAFAGLGPSFGQAPSNIQSDPAYLPIDKVLDFKIVQPEVNINLPRFLLLDAASEFDGGPNDPLAKTGVNFKELVKDIKLIRLVVIDSKKKGTQEHVQKAVATLKKQVEANWTSIVSVPDGNVGIYALGDPSGEQTTGLALLIYDKGDAVIGNVVGRVSLGKILKIAAQMDSLPKDLMKKLSGIADTAGKSAPDKSASSESKSENKPADVKPKAKSP